MHVRRPHDSILRRVKLPKSSGESEVLAPKLAVKRSGIGREKLGLSRVTRFSSSISDTRFSEADAIEAEIHQ